MLFHSFVFLLFGALFFLLWPLMRKRNNSRWVYLTSASFLFYGWWRWEFLFLILVSGLIDFFAGLGMVRFPHRRKLLLLLSIVGNIGSLAIFKYLDFFVDNLNSLFGWDGPENQTARFGLLLPIGISFYTFQSMSYTIDIYRGKLKPTRNLFHFFAYLSLFPQLVAGPIIRAAHLLPQLTSWKPGTPEDRWNGLRLIAHGFFKKVVIADTLAGMIETAFSTAHPEHAGSYWWVIVSLFAFRIYCDFSGYSDIARGLARWMGYDFPKNFDHPYLAKSFREFWGRWHISLSTWFRDYVYIPLGGSRRGPVVGHRNMWITMVVSGFWHGAAWHFVIWGALHALYLNLERLTGWHERLGSGFVGRLVRSAVVLVLVWVAWVFFRAETFDQALFIISRMFDFSSFTLQGIKLVSKPALVALAIAVLREAYFYFGLDRWMPQNARLRVAMDPVVVALILAACVYLRGPGAAFIYFQF